MKKLFIFLSTIYYLLSTATSAAAQSASLALTPPISEILLAPNKKIVQAFTLTNQGESGEFIINIHSVSPSDSYGHSTLSPTPIDPSKLPLTLTLNNSDLTLNEPFPLQAGMSKQLVLEIESATVDSTSDHYLALLASPYQAQTTQDSSLTQPGIASLIFVTLSPDGLLPINLEVKDFELPLIHDSSTPLTLAPTLVNNSPTMLRTTGSLLASSPRNNLSEQINLYPSLTLAHSSRSLQALLTRGECPNNLPDLIDQSSKSSTCQLLPNDLTLTPTLRWIGPYRLKLTINSIGGSQITTIEKVVWFLPLRLTLTITLLAIIAISLLIHTKKPNSTINDKSD